MTQPLRLVALVGSLRAGSLNRHLAESLAALAPDDVQIEVLPNIGDIPHYNSDLQEQGFPAAVTALGDRIRAADGVVIVSPEYNYSVPGVLKNALDWLSRLPDQPFAGKPIAIQSASMGAVGGARMQYHLRQIFVFLDGHVLSRPEVMVGAAHEKFDREGRLIDESTRKHVAQQLAAFAALIRRLGRNAT